jgi:Predicted transcriptional regulators
VGATGGRTWKIGELSRMTGLTVRTLHHYDHVGLLRPSARTAAGHRLYDARDVDRLYRIVALRELGLPLESIGEVLAGGPRLVDLLREHLAHVDVRLRAVRALRDRLAALVRRVETATPPTPLDLLDVIGEVTRMEETIRSYFSEEQLATLAQRRERIGDEAVEAAQREWPELIARVQAELDAGTDPAEPRVRALARRWMELLELFHGGDPGLRDSLYRMQAENSDQIRQQYGGPTPELIEYVTRANAAG